MNKTMTLDELQRWVNDKSGEEEENFTSHKYAYNTMWRFIDDNSKALEAGMRGALTFRIKRDVAIRGRYWYIAVLLNEDGDETDFWRPICWPSKDRVKDSINKKVKCLGLTAEFMEAPDEKTTDPEAT